MAENVQQSGSGNNALYFIVGGLVVFAVAAFLFFGGYLGDGADGPDSTNITIEAPRPPTAPTAPAN